jgi:cell division septation protein DedD
MNGCAGNKMALTKGQSDIDLTKKSIALLSVRISNQYKPKRQLELMSVSICPQSESNCKHDLPSRYESPYKPYKREKNSFNEYLLSYVLDSGTFNIDGFYTTYRIPTLISGFGFTKLNLKTEIKPNSISYLGHIDIILREKKSNDETSAGGDIPFIDQSIAGFSSGTFDVVVEDKFDEDMKSFISEYPALQKVKVEKSILPQLIGPSKDAAVAPKVEESAISKEVVITPKAEKPVTPKEVVATPKIEEPVTPKEVVIPKVEESATPKEAVVTPKIEEPVTPKEVVAASPLFAAYSGHVASFKNEHKAIIFVNKMKAKGLVAFYHKEEVPEKGELYRVYIGRYKTFPIARQALTKLKKAGEINFFQIHKTAEKNGGKVAKEMGLEAQKNEPAQKPKSKTMNSINTQQNYKRIKGIILKNGKVVKGQIISIHNNVLKIRTKRGKILSYSFMKVKKYITE